MRGIVKWFDVKKGWGFILADGVDRDILVHYKDIKMEGHRQIYPGQDVAFELVEGEKGPLAKAVMPEDVCKNEIVFRQAVMWHLKRLIGEAVKLKRALVEKGVIDVEEDSHDHGVHDGSRV